MKESQTHREHALGSTVVARARSYLGLPYREHPLIGSHDKNEEFVTTRDGFDCVTFVETVLAECFSSALLSNFEDELRLLRYREGVVSWMARLHYFSEWLTTNAVRGVLSPVFPDLPATTRTLSLLPHYPAITVDLQFLPLAALSERLEEFASGDIIAFGTTRPNLDVLHTGFLELSPLNTPILLHATKSFGKVTEEPLESFLKRFGASPGLLVYRPIVTKATHTTRIS